MSNIEVEKKWACVKNNKVELVIVWDGIKNWPPANDYEMVELTNESFAGIDWDYIDGEFVDNRPKTEMGAS
jgi:hypothetical protein